MPTDPAPFLSTVILANAALVGIVGGLLIGRIVSIVSDLQGSQKVLADARGRLVKTSARAEAAHNELVLWRSRDLLQHPLVLRHLDPDQPGQAKPADLRELVPTGLSDDELNHLIEQVRTEFVHAREVLDSVAELVRRDDPNSAAEAMSRLNKPKPDWPEVWRDVYIEIHEGEDIRKRRKKEEKKRDPVKALTDSIAELRKPKPLALPEPADDQAARFLRTAGWSMPRTGAGEIEARRYDQVAVTDERARQRVEDLADELERLRQAHNRIVRPGAAALWSGAVILVTFAIAGVLFPMWVMSTGPSDLSDADVRWTFYTSAIGLLALLGYIVWYLLTSPAGGCRTRMCRTPSCLFSQRL